ncbi:hypothetical protein [Streptomyces sp. NPDC008150]|uniref:hypothetical protein n=1 Tax=Streptomyces sp. NPDC008150 TaxID=3364816 RepID=UPI0036EC3367
MTPAEVSGPPGAEYYQTEVEFGDGSSLVTRLDTGHVSTTPSSNGSVSNEAQQAAKDGSVNTTTNSRVTDSRTATPQGYTLHGNKKTDSYHYRSDLGAAKLDRCTNGRCTVQGTVQVQLKQTMNGGSSHRWTLGLLADHRAGVPYAFGYDYYCGVNVPNAADWTCGTHDATADGNNSAHPVNGSTSTYKHDLNRDFGAHETNRTKFPMVGYHVSWPGYPANVNIRYRGWDVRRYSGVWKLAPATGTG